MKIQPVLSFFLLATLSGTSLSAFSQNTNSIYSAYGVGDVNIRDWNAYANMGGAGVALKSERTLNELNPASYSGLTNHRYILEVAGAGTSVNYITKTDNLRATDLNIKRAAFGMNLFNNLGTSFGIRKYSTISYQTAATRYVAGSNTAIEEKIKGSGGINQAFISNSYSIGKHLSLGVSTGLLFGSINKKEIVNYNSAEGINIESNSYLNRAFVNTGFQYSFKTGKTHFILGGTYQPSINLNNQVTSEIKDLSGNVLKASSATNTKFRYPAQLSGGVSVRNGGSTLAFDYIQQNWSNTGYKGSAFTTTNLQNYAIGYAYSFYKKSAFGPVERTSIMAGFQRDLSYLVINNRQVTSFAGSLGVNFPSRSGRFNYTAGIRAGQRGEVAYPLVKEKFVDFTFNISLGDIFYIGGRKYD